MLNDKLFLTVYLHVSSSQIKLNFNLQGGGRKNWKIKISQIPCSSSYLGSSKSFTFSYYEISINFQFFILQLQVTAFSTIQGRVKVFRRFTRKKYSWEEAQGRGICLMFSVDGTEDRVKR